MDSLVQWKVKGYTVGLSLMALWPMFNAHAEKSSNATTAPFG